MRRRTLVVFFLWVTSVAISLSVAAAIALFVVLSREPPISKTAYDQLRLGMTEAEVKAILPFTPGAYAGSFGYGTGSIAREGELAPGIEFLDRPDGTIFYQHPRTERVVTGHWWRGSEALIIVFYGEQKTVIERRFYAGYPVPLRRAVVEWARSLFE